MELLENEPRPFDSFSDDSYDEIEKPLNITKGKFYSEYNLTTANNKQMKLEEQQTKSVSNFTLNKIQKHKYSHVTSKVKAYRMQIKEQQKLSGIVNKSKDYTEIKKPFNRKEILDTNLAEGILKRLAQCEEKLNDICSQEIICQKSTPKISRSKILNEIQTPTLTFGFNDNTSLVTSESDINSSDFEIDYNSKLQKSRSTGSTSSFTSVDHLFKNKNIKKRESIGSKIMNFLKVPTPKKKRQFFKKTNAVFPYETNKNITGFDYYKKTNASNLNNKNAEIKKEIDKTIFLSPSYKKNYLGLARKIQNTEQLHHSDFDLLQNRVSVYDEVQNIKDLAVQLVQRIESLELLISNKIKQEI